ncbi:MAG: transcriptional regulator NrdR [bacterium]
MKCPFCGVDNDKVVDSRAMQEGTSIRRRRECLNCHNRFTTYERIEEIQLLVIKRNHQREPYDRSKIERSIRLACQKRPVSEEQIQEITSRIEHHLYTGLEREVPSSVIGESVMQELSNLDQVAYVRFASVYREFKDIQQFLDELNMIMQKNK